MPRRSTLLQQARKHHVRTRDEGDFPGRGEADRSRDGMAGAPALDGIGAGSDCFFDEADVRAVRDAVSRYAAFASETIEADRRALASGKRLQVCRGTGRVPAVGGRSSPMGDDAERWQTVQRWLVQLPSAEGRLLAARRRCSLSGDLRNVYGGREIVCRCPPPPFPPPPPRLRSTWYGHGVSNSLSLVPSTGRKKNKRVILPPDPPDSQGKYMVLDSKNELANRLRGVLSGFLLGMFTDRVFVADITYQKDVTKGLLGALFEDPGYQVIPWPSVPGAGVGFAARHPRLGSEMPPVPCRREGWRGQLGLCEAGRLRVSSTRGASTECRGGLSDSTVVVS